MSRPKKDRYYLDIARSVSARSPCTRRKFGAIIVVEDSIASTGYNGPARGVDNCSLGCLKDKKDAKQYAGYDWCPAVHAEENAVINAARNGVSVMGGTLYILGVRPGGETTVSEPCKRCSRVLVNAGIARVVTMDKSGEVVEYTPRDWVNRDDRWYKENMRD